MQNNLSIERSKQEQSAQTTKIKPKWHMTVLHVVYYLIMIAFLVFYMLPFWGTVMTSFKSNSEVMTTTPIIEQVEVPVQQRVLYRAGRGNILALPSDSDSTFADHQRP